MLNRNQRCACLQERLPQTQKKKKEAKVLALRNRLRKSGRRACKSARFRNAKEARGARFKKSSEEIGAKGLRKVLNTADTDTQEILPHRASVPRSSGPPEYFFWKKNIEARKKIRPLKMINVRLYGCTCRLELVLATIYDAVNNLTF